MYEAYWKLNRRPFDDGVAPEFYSPSPSHQASLLKLRYLIEQQKGIGLVAGDHGLGKTFLTHVLERECQDERIGPFIRLVIPTLSANETLAYLANRLGVRIDSGGESVLLALEEKLQELSRQEKQPVFVIDDAHLLDMEHLNCLRLLSNLRENGVGNFSIILSGRTDLLSKVKRLKSLDQRISVRMALRPLTAVEVESYLEHRLEAAGASHLFDSRSAQSIWELSQGVPRKINQICDLALLVGFVDQLASISHIEIEAAAEELICVKA